MTVPAREPALHARSATPPRRGVIAGSDRPVTRRQRLGQRSSPRRTGVSRLRAQRHVAAPAAPHDARGDASSGHRATTGARVERAAGDQVDTDPQRATGSTVHDRLGQPRDADAGTGLNVHGTVTNTGRPDLAEAKVYLDDRRPTRPPTKGVLDDFAVTDDRRVRQPGHRHRLLRRARRPPAGRRRRRTSCGPVRPAPDQRGAPASTTSASTRARTSARARDANADARADTMIPLLPRRRRRPADDRHRHADPDHAPRSRRQAERHLPRRRPRRPIVVRRPAAQPARLRRSTRPANTWRSCSTRRCRRRSPTWPTATRCSRSPSRSPATRPCPAADRATAQPWLDGPRRRVAAAQHVIFCPGASPDTSALGTDRLPGVVDAAVRASQRYAADQRIYDRRGRLAERRRRDPARARGRSRRPARPLHIVSQTSLHPARARPTDGRLPAEPVVRSPTTPDRPRPWSPAPTSAGDADDPTMTACSSARTSSPRRPSGVARPRPRASR